VGAPDQAAKLRDLVRQHEAALKLLAAKLIEKNARHMPRDIEALWALEKGSYRYVQAVTR